MPRSWSGALLLLCACIKQNPAYDDAEVGPPDASTGDPHVELTSTGTTGPTEPSTGGTLTGPTCELDEDCSDGLFCTGDEVCAPGSTDADLGGCVPGAPPCGPGMTCDEPGAVCLDACAVDPDGDDDGAPALACGGLDCEDADPTIFPGQAEACDAIDDDCDPATIGTLDADADGLISAQCCNGPVCGDDCDDSLPGLGLGDWAHCGGCGMSCGALESCVAAACVSARRVFVTSSKHDGDLGGLAGADARCQARADEALLGGKFMAYMIDDDTGLDRLEQPEVPFVRLDGVQIADNWADLADESIDAPFAVDELRQPTGDHAWTGLRDVGGGGVSSCVNWSFGGGDCLQNNMCGGAGEVGQTDDHWDGFFVFDCSASYHLFCVEQA
jgi:hypothetical protein